MIVLVLLAWVYLMKEKSEVFSIFKTFHGMICTQFSTVVKILRSDQRGESMYDGLVGYFF